MNDGVEVTNDNIPVDLLKIPGKKKDFLQANDVLITKLVAINKKHKKLQECKDYTVMPLQGYKEEFVVHPRNLKMRDCNVLECFYVLTKYSQYNWIISRGKFSFFICSICFSFLMNCVVCVIIL